MGYTVNKEKEILELLKQDLDEHRLLHSIGCAKCAAELACDFGLNEQKAYVAGLLHDCAKCFSKDKMFEYVELVELKEGECENFKVLHAPVSAYIAEKKYGIEDKEILSAIRWHTIGHVNMSNFEKIIFLADKIEPMTRNLEYSEMILNILKEPDGLNKALLVCYKETIKSLLRRDLKICMDTVDIYNSLV